VNTHFASLVLGLAQQVEAALQGQIPPDLQQAGGDPRNLAQAVIDTLAMLQEKTAGHLDADEEKLLGELLTAVRFAFVQTAPRSGGPA